MESTCAAAGITSTLDFAVFRAQFFALHAWALGVSEVCQSFDLQIYV